MKSPWLRRRVESASVLAFHSLTGRVLPMRLTMFACGLLLCAFLHSSTAAEADGLLGDWVGGYEEDGRWVHLQAHFRSDGTEVAVTLDVPLDFRTGMRSEVVLHNSRVRFQVEKPERQLFDGKLAGG